MGLCIENDCETNANFNYINETKPLYCAKHKKDSMVNVKNKKCAEIGCLTIPCYNYKNNKNGIYCAKHKKDGMINVKDKTCEYENCITIANYNYIHNKTPLYCAKHKKDSMVNVKKKFCLEPNCTTEPTFNLAHLKSPKYCSKHKKDGMINVKDKSKHCKFLNCNTIAVYNYQNEKNGIYCAKHKKDKMIDIFSKKCVYINCNTLATYNYENNNKPIYCNTHKSDGMINVKDKNKYCKTPLCYTLSSLKKYDGYCFYCYYHLFPNNPIIRNFKTKEKLVTEYIQNNFKDINIIIDKPIYDGCSKRRPDLFIDLGYQVIICEIDEEQHNSYNSICENKRIMEISKDLYHRPLIIIRFNPDSYIDELGNKIPSCWHSDKRGIYKLNNKYVIEWNKRLEILKNTISYWIKNTSDKTIEIINLFYNK